MTLGQSVVGENDVRRSRDEEAPVDRDPLLQEGVTLLVERREVHHDAVPDIADSRRAQDARRNEVENERLPAGADGVPRVRSTLVPGHDVGVLAEEIDDLAFSLV